MYNDITAPETAYGNNLGGICSFRFVPKEWLTSDIILDPVTGTVTDTPTLIAGKTWLNASVMDNTMVYQEQEKEEKGGKYYEATLSGLFYKDETARHVSLATLRFQELVVIYTDQNKQKRIIGNGQKAMSFTVDYNTGKALKDASTFTFSLTHQLTEPAPIYEGV